ncbi:MAG: DUF1194 domain-containing protein [Rhodospirillales bacterium]|nr:DUF1194 domain-containing protein [Rhodospirillales bacterium]
MIRRYEILGFLALLALGALAAPTAVRAQPVDLLLVLAVDASGSIDADELHLQRNGYAEAFADPRILRSIRAGKHGAIAVAYIEWGTPGAPRTVIDWTRIHDETSAKAFGNAILFAPSIRQSYNAIGDAIDHAARMIRAGPFKAERAVIDVSGDGPDRRSLIPAAQARDAAVRDGITINGLALIREGSTAFEGPDGAPLAIHYRAEVIGGPGAFVVIARGYPDFARAVQSKLIREIAGEAKPGDAVAAR